MVVFVVFVVVSLSLSGDKTSVKPTIVARLSAPHPSPKALARFHCAETWSCNYYYRRLWKHTLQIYVTPVRVQAFN